MRLAFDQELAEFSAPLCSGGRPEFGPGPNIEWPKGLSPQVLREGPSSKVRRDWCSKRIKSPLLYQSEGGRGGSEPPTPGFEGRYSIQLGHNHAQDVKFNASSNLRHMTLFSSCVARISSVLNLVRRWAHSAWKRWGVLYGPRQAPPPTARSPLPVVRLCRQGYRQGESKPVLPPERARGVPPGPPRPPWRPGRAS